MTRVNPNTIAEATEMAQAECRKHGRDAEFVPDAVPDGNATFKCVDDEAELARDKEIRDAKRARSSEKPQTTKQTPRGFFCSSSPTNSAAGFCARDKAECQRTRDAAIVGVADLTECTLTETAWCADKRCAPREEICVATRARFGGDAAEECIEEK